MSIVSQSGKDDEKMQMFLDEMRGQIEDLYELDDIAECGELVTCKPGGQPYFSDDIETTFYWVKDVNDHEFKMIVPPYMMWAYKLVGLKAAQEATEDFFYHQAVVLNELMCKIFGVDEFNDNNELRCYTMGDVKKVWQYALKKYPYKGAFDLGNDKYMFGK